MIERFLEAQSNGVYETALREIARDGYKSSHWMWYIFPQLDGLSFSPMGEKYSIKDFYEAKEYVSDPVLYQRLLMISYAVLNIEGHSIDYIFQYPDDLKFKSCMTLFRLVCPNEPVFQLNLEKYFNGEMCEYTKNKFYRT
jgi:uncharacterized protein (DUF1810 family)